MKSGVAAGVGVSIGVLAVLACGSGPTSYDVRSKVSVGAPAALPAPGVHTVPPDRALVPIAVVATGNAYPEAAGALRTLVDTITAAGAEGGCPVTLLDYAPAETHRPKERGGSRARAELAADLPLVGLATVAERMDRLDACLGALAEADTGDHVSIGDPVLRVDAPEASFDLLAGRFAAEQARAVAAAGPQSHPEDRRCVPTGRVRVGEARLSGVQVALDLDCRIAPAGPPADGA